MKLVSVFMGIIGAALFFSHLVDVYLHGEDHTGIMLYHWLSMIAGGVMILGITLYVIERRRPLP